MAALNPPILCKGDSVAFCFSFFVFIPYVLVRTSTRGGYWTPLCFCFFASFRSSTYFLFVCVWSDRTAEQCRHLVLGYVGGRSVRLYFIKRIWGKNDIILWWWNTFYLSCSKDPIGRKRGIWVDSHPWIPFPVKIFFFFYILLVFLLLLRFFFLIIFTISFAPSILSFVVFPRLRLVPPITSKYKKTWWIRVDELPGASGLQMPGIVSFVFCAVRI